MINFTYRKHILVSILFAVIFLVGGARTVSAAEYHFIYHDKNISPVVPIISDAYGTQGECQSQSQSVTGSVATGYVLDQGCAPGTMSEQQARATQVQNAATAIVAQDSGPTEIANYNCIPTIKGCPPILTFYFIYRPTMYLLIGTGYIFDKMLSLSIEGPLVAPSFVDSSWLIVRDFSNMLFIFILIYTGVQTILGSKDWRGVVINVVVMALLINFSLFFTKVVIDAGNVLAVGIKNSISPGSSISAGLVGAFGPQVFLNKAGEVGPIDATVVFLIASIVSGFTAFILFKAAILFSRRLIVFWGLMIMSPFAFVSIALPGRANKFKEWTEELTNQAFVAPIFLFFIYLIAKILSVGNILVSAGFAQTAGTNGTVAGWFESLIGPIIVAALIIKALQESIKFSEGFAGSTGSEFSSLVGGAMGLAGGGMLSAGAGAMRIGAGMTAGKILASGTLKEGGLAHTLATKATQASYDVRNIGGKDSIFGAKIGGKISEGIGAFGMGKGGGVGGAEKAAQNRVKKATDRATKMNVFEEQGAHERAVKEAEKQQGGRKEPAEKASLNLKLMTDRVAQAQKDFDNAQKTDNDSKENVTKTKIAYDAAVSARIKAGTNPSKEEIDAVDATKLAHGKAMATYAASGTSAKLQETLNKLRDAKKAEQEAIAAAAREGAQKEGTEEKPKSAYEVAQEIAAKNIAEENERRRKAHAEKEASKGNYIAAAKIRKGEESGHAKKGRELAAELKKEKEGKARPEVIEHIEEKIEEHKGNK